ncbi:MAG: hypothetical protein QGG36_27110 [Pirellulaceae bacterium]|nr:hypothetical protein [Pirellulaceae bacterium]MDP7019497.1 hypothetical protein [Pirellulaceae bacterium]
MTDSSTPFALRLYSAPRQFDLATLMVISAAYAMLFGLMRWIGVSPLLMLFVAGGLTLVMIAQAWVLKGRFPRVSSMLVSMPYWAAVMAYAGISSGSSWWPFQAAFGGVFGVFFGYAGGALVGGVFLVADIARQLMGGKRDEVLEKTPHDEKTPFRDVEK